MTASVETTSKPPTDRDIALCYGTRPQVIKASVLRRTLGARWNVFACDSGQHYDYVLNALLYEQLHVTPADRFLEVGSGSQAEQTALVLTRAEVAFRERRPRAAVVVGDTNSTVGAALAAAKLRIPVVHVEAGLRAHDTMMAEEVNRRVVDACAHVLCTPCASATVRARQANPDAIVVETGDVARDVLMEVLPRARNDMPLEPGGYVYATLHRAELADDPPLLEHALAAIARLPVPVLLAAHPRTVDRLGGLSQLARFGGNLRVSEAVGYFESISLTNGASAVITDSGGVQREAYWLGVPCVTLRTETEWGETVSLGANRVVAPSRVDGDLPAALDQALGSTRDWDRDAYGRGDAGQRIADALEGLWG